MRSSSISWPTNSPTSCSTRGGRTAWWRRWPSPSRWRSEEHTSELQSRSDLVCRLLLEKKKKKDDVGLETDSSMSRFKVRDNDVFTLELTNKTAVRHLWRAAAARRGLAAIRRGCARRTR